MYSSQTVAAVLFVLDLARRQRHFGELFDDQGHVDETMVVLTPNLAQIVPPREESRYAIKVIGPQAAPPKTSQAKRV